MNKNIEIVDKTDIQSLTFELGFLQSDIVPSIKELMAQMDEKSQSSAQKILQATETLESVKNSSTQTSEAFRKNVEASINANIEIYKKIAGDLAAGLQKMDEISISTIEEFKATKEELQKTKEELQKTNKQAEDLSKKVSRLKDVYMQSIEETIKKSFDESWEKAVKAEFEVGKKIDETMTKIQKTSDGIDKRAIDMNKEINKKVMETLSNFQNRETESDVAIKDFQKINQVALVRYEKFFNDMEAEFYKKMQEMEEKNQKFFDSQKGIKLIAMTSIFVSGGLLVIACLYGVGAL